MAYAANRAGMSRLVRARRLRPMVPKASEVARPRICLRRFQAVPDDLQQVGEASEGDVGQGPALEGRPDPFHRVQAGGAGRELENLWPRLGGDESAQLRAQVHIEVVPDQDYVPTGQLVMGGGEQVAVTRSR